MVRVKSRWIIVSIEFQRDVLLSSSSSATATDEINNNMISSSSTSTTTAASSTTNLFPTPVQLSHTIRDHILQYFGDTAMGATLGVNIHVRFCDPVSKLAIIRVSREYYSMVCSAITYITVYNQRRIVISIQSIHGSARTTKIKAIRIIKNIWKHHILSFKHQHYQEMQNIVMSNAKKLIASSNNNNNTIPNHDKEENTRRKRDISNTNNTLIMTPSSKTSTTNTTDKSLSSNNRKTSFETIINRMCRSFDEVLNQINNIG